MPEISESDYELQMLAIMRRIQDAVEKIALNTTPPSKAPDA